MFLNDLGKMAEDCWLAIPLHFPNVSLDEFTIMPNHIHGIVCINEKIEIERTTVETYNYTSLQTPKNSHFQNLSAPAKSLSTIIRAFKTVVTTESRKINPNFAWQPRFFESII
jgi:REP element-mobilizing transposase RayT